MKKALLLLLLLLLTPARTMWAAGCGTLVINPATGLLDCTNAAGVDVTTVANSGAGAQVLKAATNVTARTLVGAQGIALTQNTDTVTVGIQIGTAVPGTCTLGDIFFDTDASAGENWYGCTATNTWTLQGGDAATASNQSANQLYAGPSSGGAAAPAFRAMVMDDIPATVDFSGKTATSPAKAGTSAPGTCTVGEVFFDTDATAGLNLFGCTSTNTWTLLGDGGGAGTVTSVFTRTGDVVATARDYFPNQLGCDVVRTSATILTAFTDASAAKPCNFRFGSKVYSFTASGTVTISSGSGADTIYLYVANDGTLSFGHNAGNTYSGSGVTAATPITAFPADSIPIWSWGVTTGNYDASGTDSRAFLSTKNTIAGTYMNIVSNPSTGNDTFNVDFSSGLDLSTSPFTRVTIGAGAPTGTDCDAAGEVGKVYMRSDASAAFASFYTCSNTGVATYAWEGPYGAGGGGISGATSTQVVVATGATTGTSYAGMVFDGTSKLTVKHPGTANRGGELYIENGSGLAAGRYSELVINAASGGGTVPSFMGNYYGNLDGSGNAYWATWGQNSSPDGVTGTVMSRRHTGGPLYIGGSGYTSGSTMPAGVTISIRTASTTSYNYMGSGTSQSTTPVFGLGTLTTEKATWLEGGTLAMYNGEATAGLGQAYTRASSDLTAQAAAVASGNLLASASAGVYRVSAYIHTTSAPGATCTANVIIGWTYNSGAKTKTAINAHDLNVDESASDSTTVIKVDAASNITREVTNTGTCGTYTYDVSFRLEKL